MRNSSRASSDTRLLVPPNTLVAGSWPAPPCPRCGAPSGRSQVGAHSIHQEVIGIRPLAIHAELAALVLVGRRQHHSRRQIDEGAEAAAVQGQVLHELVIDHRAHRCIHVIEQGRASFYGDRLGSAADRQSKIQSCALVHFDEDAALANCFKAVGVYRDVIRARSQRGDAVLALLIRNNAPGCTVGRAL